MKTTFVSGIRYASITLASLALACASYGEKIRGYNLTRSVELSGENIQIKVPNGATPETMQPPQVFHATRRADGVQVEMYSLRELWRAPQRMGQWTADSGHAVHAAVITTSAPDIPAKESDGIRLREECDKILSSCTRPDPDDAEALMKWAEAFAGADRDGALTALPDTITLHHLKIGALKKSNDTVAVLFFSVKPGMHGADPEKQYALFYSFDGEPSSEDATSLITRLGPPSITTLGRPAKMSAPVTKSAPENEKETPERKRSREVVLQTIRGLPKWWSLESEHYIIVSDLSGTDRSFVQRLSQNLNQFLEVYRSFIPPVRPIEAVSAVRVFAKSEDYLSYVGPGYEWSGGMWNPSKVELIIRVSGWQVGKDKRSSIANTIQHEALHQYLFYALPGIELNVWYNEGHATFMEGVQLTQHGPRIDESEEYAPIVDRAVEKGDADMAKLIQLTYPQFYNGDGSDWGRSRNYALAWGLVYYLRKGVQDDPDPRFAQIMTRYESALRSGKKTEEANQYAFAEVSPSKLNKAFLEFWASGNRRAAARRREISELIAPAK